MEQWPLLRVLIMFGLGDHNTSLPVQGPPEGRGSGPRWCQKGFVCMFAMSRHKTPSSHYVVGATSMVRRHGVRPPPQTPTEV